MLEPELGDEAETAAEARGSMDVVDVVAVVGTCDADVLGLEGSAFSTDEDVVSDSDASGAPVAASGVDVAEAVAWLAVTSLLTVPVVEEAAIAEESCGVML